jgi:hypothetical protein
MVVLMLIASVLPIILSVIFTGSPPMSYTPLEAIDWAWTLVEAFDKGYSPYLAGLILITGAIVTFFNLALLIGEFRYRRISVPKRVLEDELAES